MIYTKQESDGYTKVSAGACQLQCKNSYRSRLGIIHSDVAPAALDKPEFIYKGDGPYITLGLADCYVIVLADTPLEFSATEI